MFGSIKFLVTLKFVKKCLRTFLLAKKQTANSAKLKFILSYHTKHGTYPTVIKMYTFNRNAVFASKNTLGLIILYERTSSIHDNLNHLTSWFTFDPHIFFLSQMKSKLK